MERKEKGWTKEKRVKGEQKHTGSYMEKAIKKDGKAERE